MIGSSADLVQRDWVAITRIDLQFRDSTNVMRLKCERRAWLRQTAARWMLTRENGLMPTAGFPAPAGGGGPGE